MLLSSLLLTQSRHPGLGGRTPSRQSLPLEDAHPPAEGQAGDDVAENTDPGLMSYRLEPGAEEQAEPGLPQPRARSPGPAPPPREASPAALSRDTRRQREHEGRHWSASHPLNRSRV